MWGIDERAIVFDNTEGEDYYDSLKERYTVAGLVDKRGHEVERYTYDAYGRPTIRSIPPEDVDYSGTVTPLDEWAINTRISQAVCDYGPIYDLDDDGTIDSGDEAIANAASTAGKSVTTLFTSAIRNPYLFTGRRLFTLEADLTGVGPTANQPLQYNRARHYDPEHGRWLQRDPMGYVDGLQLYEYVSSRPTNIIDPNGKVGVVAPVVSAVAVLTVACAYPQLEAAHSRHPDSTDKFKHCWVSCRVSKTCGGLITQLAGLGKEGFDAVKRLLNKRAGGIGDWADSLDDLIANQQCVRWETYAFGAIGGWIGTLCRESCEDCCRREVGYQHVENTESNSQ